MEASPFLASLCRYGRNLIRTSQTYFGQFYGSTKILSESIRPLSNMKNWNQFEERQYDIAVQGIALGGALYISFFSVIIIVLSAMFIL